MRAVSAKQKGTKPDGTRIMDVFLLADSDPDTLPTNGNGIDGLLPTDVFAPFSILFALPSNVYIANESGAFTST